MMTQTEALDRVQKLLRLAKSDNPNEAAAAAAMAQRVMDQYKLDLAMLATSEPEEKIGIDPDPLERDYAGWKSWLSQVIAKLNACSVYKSAGSLVIVGRQSDIQTVRYIYQWLVLEVERLTAKTPRGQGKTWYNNFRLGMVDVLAKRLEASKKETETQARANAFATSGEQGLSQMSSAIVRVSESGLATEAWVKSHLKLRSVSSTVRFNPNAREAGKAAGATVNLTANGTLGAGARRIGG